MPEKDKISEFREVILKLHSVGSDGFEGLLAVALTETTKTVFNLAKSGTQGGKDGQSALNSGAVTFEAKLYKGVVPPDEVITKIAQISANKNGRTELFIIGSTSTVSTQTAETIAAAGSRRRRSGCRRASRTQDPTR